MPIPQLLAQAGGDVPSDLGYLALVNIVVWTGLFAYLVRLRFRLRDLERKTRP